MKRLSSSDPFTATYQLEDGTILVTNEDISQGIPDPENEVEPPIIQWVDPDNGTRDIFQGEIIAYFFDSATQNDVEQFILDHNLHVIMSWFEPPDEGEEGNALAWFHFEYDQNEFPTFDDAYSFFSSHELVASTWPAFFAADKAAYLLVTDPNDYYYYYDDVSGGKYGYPHRQNSYVNVLGVDESPYVRPGPSNGVWYSDQYNVVIDDGIWRYHPEFWITQGPWPGWGKITWVGVNTYHRSYRVGYWYGGPNSWDPNRGTLATHGTQVAGMLTATTNDMRGVASLAPGNAVMPIRLKVRWVWNGKYYEDRYDPSSCVKAVRALRFQFAHNQWYGKFRVVNMSFGGERPWYWWMYPSDRYNMKKNINRDLNRNDRLYVAAAGNDYSAVRSYPAAFDNVLGVSGLFTNRFGTTWHHYYSPARWGSNYRNDGYATYPVSGICDFIERYYNPIPQGWDTIYVGRTLSTAYFPWQHNDQWYRHFNGTSAATPEVAALAACLYGRKPYRNYRSVWNRIVDSRDDSKARGYVAGLVDYDAAIEGW
ncbi:S8/S53 family peptidase [bacterium]|nr:S8/S53 family peptidase [bacterium]